MHLVPFNAVRPNIARAYDYLLGGKDHCAPDRELAERLLAIYPGTRQMVRENRRFLVIALDYVRAQARAPATTGPTPPPRVARR